MISSNKYKELEERVKLCDDPNTKIDWLASMVFMIASNDLATIESKLSKNAKRINKNTIFIILALLVGMIGSNQGAMDFIVGLIMKAL